MTLRLRVDPHVDSIVMPENLKVGMMVNQVRKECARKGISCNYNGFAVDNYLKKPPRNKEEETAFVKENAPRMIRGVRSLKAYIEDIKQ